MTETWDAICLVAAAAIYSSLLLTALYPAVSKTLVAIFARLKKRHVEDILLVVFVCSAICAEPGPPTARVTLFALDEANLPR